MTTPAAPDLQEAPHTFSFNYAQAMKLGYLAIRLAGQGFRVTVTAFQPWPEERPDAVAIGAIRNTDDKQVGLICVSDDIDKDKIGVIFFGNAPDEEIETFKTVHAEIIKPENGWPKV